MCDAGTLQARRTALTSKLPAGEEHPCKNGNGSKRDESDKTDDGPHPSKNREKFHIIHGNLYIVPPFYISGVRLKGVVGKTPHIVIKTLQNAKCYYAWMLIDAVPFARRIQNSSGAVLRKSVLAFTSFLESRLGAKFVYGSETLPYGQADLAELGDLAQSLYANRIIKGFRRSWLLPDEPQIRLWRAECATHHLHMTGGISTNSDRDALTAALAESVERFIWYEETDYFHSPVRAGTAAIKVRKNLIEPSRFTGHAPEANAGEYLWIRGYSWTQGRSVYIPAQMVSAKHHKEMRTTGEKSIRPAITTGLATWPTKTGAVLRGALEVIERDAFMVMWLNGLTLPKIPLEPLRAQLSSLDMLLQMCAQYRLEVQIVRLITDAPAYAVCAIVRDQSSVGPAITLGLKAHKSLTHAIEAALLEALRARSNVRNMPKEKLSSEHKNIARWSLPENLKNLAFIDAGEEIPVSQDSWNNDSEEEHLGRILAWCRAKGYECASVSLGRSKKNITPWHIEMVLIPEMQPLYKGTQYIGTDGPRIQTVPREFGYEPAPVLRTEEPLPFV